MVDLFAVDGGGEQIEQLHRAATPTAAAEEECWELEVALRKGVVEALSKLNSRAGRVPVTLWQRRAAESALPSCVRHRFVANLRLSLSLRFRRSRRRGGWRRRRLGRGGGCRGRARGGGFGFGSSEILLGFDVIDGGDGEGEALGELNAAEDGDGDELVSKAHEAGGAEEEGRGGADAGGHDLGDAEEGGGDGDGGDGRLDRHGDAVEPVTTLKRSLSRPSGR